MFQPFLLPKRTRDGDEVELERLREWFEAEVKANAEVRRNVTGV